jgi:hypothetical protein
MLSSFALVIITLIEGFVVEETFAFIFTECLLNILILADFIARIKLTGLAKFIEGGLWNFFDAIVVVGCLIMFLIMVIP